SRADPVFTRIVARTAAPLIRRNPQLRGTIYVRAGRCGSRRRFAGDSVWGMHQHAAHQLDAAAHALRNDIATLRMATRLVDDADVAESMARAIDDLQVRLERAVVAARIDLERPPARITIAAAELQRLGAARAAREGRRDPTVDVRIHGDELVDVPGTWV